MLVRPNENDQLETQTVKNDLYRRFKDYFIGATEKEFHQFGSYPTEGYISVNPVVEQRVFDTFNHSIDEVLPLTGATGIGKTYLLLYCLKTRYQVDKIPTNNAKIFPHGGGYDLVYYSDFSITEEVVLRNPLNLILAKIRAMSDAIVDFFDIEEPDIDKFIREEKREVAYYANLGHRYQRELFRLTGLLRSSKVPINNVIFIFDDLESLDGNNQFSLIKQFLQLYDNLKEKSSGKYNAKFLFCLRSSTYYNIYKQNFYNTHRASKDAKLTIAPSLSQIFERRFSIILNSEKVKKAKNQTTWKEARDILLSISRRIDNSYSNLLTRLNNNNVSNALDSFLSILSNRRWTQRNVNPAASFHIEESDYYINDSNILRILSMDERNIYYKSTSYPIRCILPNPGVSSQNDLFCLLLLRAFRQNSVTDIDEPAAPTKMILEDDLVDSFSSCILSIEEVKSTNKKEKIAKQFHDAFVYYAENRFIRKNDNPYEAQGEHAYFMLPRGEQIFDLFFSQSILFSIFRDTYLWSSKTFRTQCSCRLLFSELLSETIKYEETLIAIETKLFKKITENNTWRVYISLFGTWSVSHNFLQGIKKSMQQFYKEGDYPIPEEISSEIVNIEKRVSSLLELLDNFDDEVDDILDG